MAAAMRAKQPSGEAGDQPKTRGSQNSELELAALDDEPYRSAGTRSTESARAETARSGAEAREKQRKAAETGAAGKRPPERAKTAAVATATPPAKRPPHSDSKRALAKADVLSELLPKGILSGSSSGSLAIPSVDEHLPPHVRLPAYRRSGVEKFLRSPWVWIGVLWVVIVVLLVQLILNKSSSEGTGTVDQHPAHGATESSQKTDADRPSSLIDLLTPKKKAADTSQAEPKSKEESAEPASRAEEPRPDSEPPPAAPKKPAEPSSPSKPDDKSSAESSPPAPKPEEKPKVEEKLPPEKPEELLAQMTKVIVPEAKSNDATIDTVIGVTRTVVEKRLHMVIGDPRLDAGVHGVGLLTIGLGGNPANLIMSAELKCWNRDHQLITVWTGKPKTVLRGPVAPQQYAKTLKTGVTKFFDQFIEEVQDTRAKFKSK
jgi:hypothetical protein